MKEIKGYECDICQARFWHIKAIAQHEEACKWEHAGEVVWYEDGRVMHAPGIPSGVFGPHDYKSKGTSDCANGCGCWAGPARSGGPVDPLGPCPRNPLAALKGER